MPSTTNLQHPLWGAHLLGPLIPLGGENSSIATHYSWFGHGGVKTAQTLDEMYNIPFARRELGMLVFVLSEKVIYLLKKQAVGLQDWERCHPNGQKVVSGLYLTRAEMEAPTGADCWVHLLDATSIYDTIQEELSSRVAQFVLAMTDEDLGGTYEDGVLSGVGVLEIDGVNLPVNSRVLLNAQIDPIQNGIYSVDSQNPWLLSRVPELSQGKVIVPGTMVYVVGSDRLDRRVLVQISTEGLIGEAPLSYEQISIYKALLDCGEW